MSGVSKLGKVSVYIVAKTDAAVKLAYGKDNMELAWLPRSLLSTVSDRKVEAWRNKHEFTSVRYVLQVEQFKLNELGWEYE